MEVELRQERGFHKPAPPFFELKDRMWRGQQMSKGHHWGWIESGLQV